VPVLSARSRGNSITLQIIIYLIGAALADLFGAWLFLLRKRWEAEPLRLLIGAGAGFLLAVALLEMAPHAAGMIPTAPVWLLGGFLLVHVVEHVVPAHFHYGHETHSGLQPHVGVTATAGLTIHSLLDGVAIVAALQADSWLGGMVFAAMVWHRIPSGFTVASVVRAVGGSPGSAMLAAGVLGVAAVLGGLLWLALPQGRWLGAALSVSAGSLLYVAATDLLPEVNRRRTLLAPLGVVIGVGVYYVIHLGFGH